MAEAETEEKCPRVLKKDHREDSHEYKEKSKAVGLDARDPR